MAPRSQRDIMDVDSEHSRRLVALSVLQHPPRAFADYPSRQAVKPATHGSRLLLRC